MSEYTEVERPFLHELQKLGWDVIDQGPDIPSASGCFPRYSLRLWLVSIPPRTAAPG